MSKPRNRKSGSKPARRVPTRHRRTAAAPRTAAASLSSQARDLATKLLAIFPCPDCGSTNREPLTADKDPRNSTAEQTVLCDFAEDPTPASPVQKGAPVRCKLCDGIEILDVDARIAALGAVQLASLLESVFARKEEHTDEGAVDEAISGCFRMTVRERCELCQEEDCYHRDAGANGIEGDEPCGVPVSETRLVDGILVPVCLACADIIDEDPDEQLYYLPPGAVATDPARWVTRKGVPRALVPLYRDMETFLRGGAS